MALYNNVRSIEGWEDQSALNRYGFGGTVSIVTTPTKNSAGALRLQATNSRARLVIGELAEAKNISTYVRFATLPATDIFIFYVGQVSGFRHYTGLQYNSSTGKIRPFSFGLSEEEYGPDGAITVNSNTWYLLDFTHEYTATDSIAWRMAEEDDDPVDEGIWLPTPKSGGAIGVPILGQNDGPTGTFDMYFGPTIITNRLPGDYSPDYPIGHHGVVNLKPNGEGTHVNSSHFTDNNGNSPPVNPHLRLDESPDLGVGTDYVYQSTGSAESAMAYTLENSPALRLPILGIQINASYQTTDGNGQLIVKTHWKGNDVTVINQTVNSATRGWTQDDLGQEVVAESLDDINNVAVSHGYVSSLGTSFVRVHTLWLSVAYGIAQSDFKNHDVDALLYKPSIEPIPTKYYSPGTQQAYEDAKLNTGFEHGSLSSGVYSLGRGTFKSVVGDVSIDTAIKADGGERSLRILMESAIEPPPPDPDPDPDPDPEISVFEGTLMRFGAHVEGDPVGVYSRDGAPSNALGRLDYLEELYNASFRCMRVFRSWNEGSWDASYERQVSGRGLWMSEKARNLNSSIVRYDEIARGDHNAHIRARADEIKTLHAASPLPFIIYTFQHEPEGEQSSVDWSLTPHNTQARAYKDAYISYRDVFLRRLRSEANGLPALNIPIVFGPVFYGISYNNGTADNLWPGDDVCDFAGADAYNWNPAPGEGPYRNFSNAAVVGALANFAITHNKYACVGETGTFETAPATYDSGAVSGPTTRWDSTTFSVPTGPPYDRYPADAEFTDREATTPGNLSKAAWIDRARTWLKTQKFTTGEKAGHYVFQVVCWYDATGNYNRYSNTTPTAIAAFQDLMADAEFNPSPPTEPPPNPEPEPTDTMHNAAGTWTIKQVASATQLNAAAGDINIGLGWEGVRGFGARIPWNVIEKGRIISRAAAQGANTIQITHTYNARITAGTTLYFHHGTGMTTDVRVRVRSDYTAGQTQLLVDPIPFSIGAGARAAIYDDSLLEASYALPAAKGKKFKPRVICGRYTPGHVFDDGSPSFLDGTARIPMPFGTGGSTNTAFENAWEDLMWHLFRWARSKNTAAAKNVVPMIDAGWYSNNYSELYFGPEVQNAFGDGFAINETRFITAHSRLIDIAFPISTANVAFGFGLSGHGPIAQKIAGSLAAAMRTASGTDWSRRIFMQANGWGPNGDWGTTAQNEAVFDNNVWPKKVLRAEQDIHPANSTARTAANWITMYGYLRTNLATYAEIYAEQFKVSTNLQTEAGLTEMKKQIAEWWRVLGGTSGGGGGGDGGDPTVPTISSFSPASGPVGTSVTINGTNFTGATAVRFNTVLATFNVDSATKIIASVPSSATTGTIRVVTPTGTATSGGNFTVTTSGGGGGGGSATEPRIAGTWALQQVSSLSALNTGTALHTNITNALRNFDTTGLSIRVPWTNLETSQGVYDFSIFERGLQIAAANNKYFMVRFMAGRHTPTFYKGSANNGHLVYEGTAGAGTVDAGMGKGSTIPLAFMSNGSKNMVFWNGLMNMMSALKAWCQQNGVKVMHCAWPGLLWSEIAYIQQMIDGGQAFNYAGQPGHTFNMVSQFHVDEINNVAARAASNFYTELSVSGHVVNFQLFSNVHNALLNHANKNYVFLSSNNIGYAWKPGDPDANMLKGLPITDKRFRRGGQMVGLRNDYPWNTVFQLLKGGPTSTNECFEYLEVYIESFAGGNVASLRSNITAHKPAWL